MRGAAALCLQESRRLRVRVDGPYGHSSFDVDNAHYPVGLIVAGGIGITPAISFLRHIYNLDDAPPAPPSAPTADAPGDYWELNLWRDDGSALSIFASNALQQPCNEGVFLRRDIYVIWTVSAVVSLYIIIYIYIYIYIFKRPCQSHLFIYLLHITFMAELQEHYRWFHNTFDAARTASLRNLTLPRFHAVIYVTNPAQGR